MSEGKNEQQATSAVTGWDCHAHVFGPYDKYPLAADRSYTPPEAVQADYAAMLARHGMSHGVLVHPSAYGAEHSLLLDTLAAMPNARVVVVVQPDTMPTLKGLRDRGVRAARYSHRSGAGVNFAGSASWDDLLAMSGTLADAGLHAELWTDCKALPAIATRLKEFPFPVVIDHMGGFDVHAGIDEPGFQTLLSLLGSGKVWVKLCAYRNVLKEPSMEPGRVFHDAMLAANPDALVWGSDWPHLNVKPAPDTSKLFATFKDWTGSEEMIHRILVTNPSRLYL
ncbi:amidohydrolase [soil metagenome]